MTFQKTTTRNLTRGLALCGILIFPTLSLAQDTKSSAPLSPSASMAQMHEHMSEMHKNAASCLKSGKSENQCHEAMMSECKEQSKNMKGEMNCPMMDKMGKSGKMGHMQGHSDEPAKQ